jgi:TonB family protein
VLPGLRGDERCAVWRALARLNPDDSVLAASGCRAAVGAAGIVSVAYHPDGRIARVALSPTKLAAGCEQATLALAQLSLADPEYVTPDGQSEFMVLPLDPDYVSCGNAAGGPAEPAVDAGGTVTPPRKTRDRRPNYPLAMQQSRVQGVVVLESVITQTGCVPTVRVMRSVVPALDAAALIAVTGWRFEPATLDGRVVPVVMTVSVNFSLQ